MQLSSNNSQTIQILIVTIVALGASVLGVLGTLLMVSTVYGIPIIGDTGQPMSPKEVESKIVELIEEESATIAVVERVTPAVVSIIVKKERGSLGFGAYSFFDPSTRTIAPAPEGQEELVEVSSGTGFFVTSDGYILTNRHVVDEQDAVFSVVNNDGEELPAQLVGVDHVQDIAVLRVEGDAFPVVTLGDSDAIRIGQTVIAIGNTLSEFRNTVTKGVVSGMNRRVTAGDSYGSDVIEKAIQTDAAINPGNSGGPLINLRGEVIGINTAVSFQGESIAFAIPISEAKRVIDDVRQYGRIVRPWLGVRYVLIASQEGDDRFEVGALVVSGDQPGEEAVFVGSPADEAGLQEEDVIIALDQTRLTQDSALAEIIAHYRPGDVVRITFLRGDQLQDVDVTLAEYAP